MIFFVLFSRLKARGELGGLEERAGTGCSPNHHFRALPTLGNKYGNWTHQCSGQSKPGAGWT